jgi:voltage-gated potassium channel
MEGLVRARTHEILEKASEHDRASKVFDIFITILISLNIIAVIFETVKSLASEYMAFFMVFEVFSVSVFSLEYLLRLWACTHESPSKHPIKTRFRFALRPLSLVDLIAILPFYLPMIIPLDLRFVRVLRLLRLLRLFKLGRYSDSLKALGNVFKEKKEELLITGFALTITLIFASSLMYFVENAVQPQAFSSIPAAMWWGIATLTTVGYGDIYPVTALGKLMGAVIAILGVGMFALPAGILSSGFAQEIQKSRNKDRFCKHCGNRLED